MRAFVNPIAALAEKHSFALVFVRHVRKGGDSTKDFVGDLMANSAAWRDSVRNVFFAGRTEDGTYAVAIDKSNNTAGEAGSLSYKIISVPLLDENGHQIADQKGKAQTVAKIVWLGIAEDISLEDLSRRPNAQAKSAEDQRQKAILNALPKDGSEVRWTDIRTNLSGQDTAKARSLDALFEAQKLWKRTEGNLIYVRQFNPTKDLRSQHAEEFRLM